MAEESVDSGISSELYTIKSDQTSCNLNIELQQLEGNKNIHNLALVQSVDNFIHNPYHNQFYIECTKTNSHVGLFQNALYKNSNLDYDRFLHSVDQNYTINNPKLNKKQILSKFKKINTSSFDSAFETSSESTLSLVSNLSGSYQKLNCSIKPKYSSNFKNFNNFIEQVNKNMTEDPNKSIIQDFYTCDKQTNRYNMNEGKTLNPRVHFVPEEGVNTSNLPGPSRPTSDYTLDSTGNISDQNKMLSHLLSSRDYVYMPTNRIATSGTCNIRGGQLLSNWQRQQQPNRQQAHLYDAHPESLIHNLNHLTDNRSRNTPYFLQQQQQTSQNRIQGDQIYDPGKVSNQSQQTRLQNQPNQQQANYQQLISALLAAASASKSRLESQSSQTSNLSPMGIDTVLNQQKFNTSNRWSDSELARDESSTMRIMNPASLVTPMQTLRRFCTPDMNINESNLSQTLLLPQQPLSTMSESVPLSEQNNKLQRATQQLITQLNKFQDLSVSGDDYANYQCLESLLGQASRQPLAPAPSVQMENVLCTGS
uniref:Uncharacterized protein n=1 Tax=Schistosoma haematobium TaxID=6185 RepID=A0A094ZMD1_SCHHA